MVDRLNDPESAVSAVFSTISFDATVGIAVSGGGDSMALLALARSHVTQSGHTLAVATVDHGLRPESAAEAEQVARTCAAWGLPHRTLVLGALDGPGNLSALARDARYDALSGWAKAQDATTVLLGHTMDDQAETVLMRLARGSGVEGLSGMPDEMTWNSVCFHRPLLGVRREVLRDWLRNHDLTWIDDPSNEDAGYDRIKARNALQLLEPLGVTIEGLSSTADRLARQRKVLEAAASELTAKSVRHGEGSMHLDRQALREAVPDTAMRVLASVLQQVGGKHYRARFRALEPLYYRILSQETTTLTLARCLIYLEATVVKIEAE